MTVSKAQAGLIAILLIISIVAPLTIKREEDAKFKAATDKWAVQLADLRAENERLRLANRRPSPHLPAPRIQNPGETTEVGPDQLSTNRLIARLALAADAPRLTPAQIEAYLKENKRSAASLVTAFRATGDKDLLHEALEKFPNDPMVNFASVFEAGATADERRQRLEALKQAAPDNAIARYLSALDYFKVGQVDQAVGELSTAAGQQTFQDYSREFIQSAEEAYLSAGYTPAEAKALGFSQLLLPQLAPLKALGQQMVDLANSYRQANDSASAQAALQMAIELGQRFNGEPGEALVSRLVGLAIQRNALGAMDLGTVLDSSGQTVEARLDEIAQQRDAIRQLDQQFEGVQPKITDQDWISYRDRERTFGEEPAMQWLVAKYSKQ
jgi:hypothetical protein